LIRIKGIQARGDDHETAIRAPVRGGDGVGPGDLGQGGNVRAVIGVEVRCGFAGVIAQGFQVEFAQGVAPFDAVAVRYAHDASFAAAFSIFPVPINITADPQPAQCIDDPDIGGPLVEKNAGIQIDFILCRGGVANILRRRTPPDKFF